MSQDVLLEVINSITFVVFLVLMTLAVTRMLIRVYAYRFTGRRPSIILRRDIALMGSLLLAFGAPVFIQFFGWGDLFFEGGEYRLIYTILRDLAGLIGLGYWVWAEYFVIGKPGKENA